LRPSAEEGRRRDDADAPQILLLPGSRRSETKRLLQLFGAVGTELARRFPSARFILPTVPHLEQSVALAVRSWPFPAEVIAGHAAKRAAFRQARVALAASGTVTLELALSGVPTVAAYRVGAVEAMVARRVVRVPSVILPNLILESRIVPEFLQEQATVSALVEAVAELVVGGEARTRQLTAFAELEARMTLAPETTAWRSPSQRAADEILDIIASRPRG
jgi:lipid-A-disaccharide synthase